MGEILILHGWGSCAKNWQRVKDGLENGGYRVFVPDLPGFGDNPPLEKAWLVDDYVEWVKDYGEKNNISQFFLLGHSFGGNIAFKFALKYPERIEKLVLVDPALIRVKNAKREIMAKMAKILKLFAFLPFYCSVRKIFYRFIVRSDYPDTEGSMRETYLRVVKEDFSGLVSDISVPTLLIWGERDKITPLKDGYFIKERIARAALEVLPGVGHSSQSENPELLIETILKHL